MSVTVLPPVPAFYNHPQDFNDIVDHIIARVVDLFGIEAKFARRWDGRMQGPRPVAGVGQALKGDRCAVGLAAIAALAPRAHFNGG